MRGGEIIWVGSPEQHKLIIPVDFAEFSALEGNEIGSIRTLLRYPDSRPTLMCEKVLLPGDEVHISLDIKYRADPTLVTAEDHFLRPLPDYDLVGVVDSIFWSDTTPFKINRIHFSSVRRIARQ